VLLLVSEGSGMVELSPEVWDRARALEKIGFKSADAVHIAAAEVGSDTFLSCDDRLCRLAKRCQASLRVRVANPVDWLREVHDAEIT
jgi:predicted nucleic acid-binding protein